MNNKEITGLISGAIASIVFTTISLLSSLRYFIVPVILFLCSVLAIAISEHQNKVHICDVCGVKLEPLPIRYKKHIHRKSNS